MACAAGPDFDRRNGASRARTGDVLGATHQLGHANPSITLKIYAHLFDAPPLTKSGSPPSSKRWLWGERQRKTAAASAGEPTTSRKGRTSLFILRWLPEATSGYSFRTLCKPEVTGSIPVRSTPDRSPAPLRAAMMTRTGSLLPRAIADARSIADVPRARTIIIARSPRL